MNINISILSPDQIQGLLPKTTPISKFYTFFGEASTNTYLRLRKEFEGAKFKVLESALERGLDPLTVEERDLGPEIREHPAFRDYKLVHRQFTQEIHKELCTGKMIAFGYETPRGLHDTPKQIPSNIWFDVADLSKDHITIGSLELEGIRIIEAEDIQTLIAVENQFDMVSKTGLVKTDKSAETQGKTEFSQTGKPKMETGLKPNSKPEYPILNRFHSETGTGFSETETDLETELKPISSSKSLPVGRHSRHDIIWQVYIDLVAEGDIDFSKSMRMAARKVQDVIKNQFPDMYGPTKGFSLETIRRVISESFLTQKRLKTGL